MSKIITTPDYWDCECENNYIHPRKHDECKVCGSIEEEQPESRLSEVYEQLFIDNRPLTNEILEELGFDDEFFHTGFDCDGAAHTLFAHKDGDYYVVNDNGYSSQTKPKWKTVGKLKMLIEALSNKGEIK